VLMDGFRCGHYGQANGSRFIPLSSRNPLPSSPCVILFSYFLHPKLQILHSFSFLFPSSVFFLTLSGNCLPLLINQIGHLADDSKLNSDCGCFICLSHSPLFNSSPSFSQLVLLIPSSPPPLVNHFFPLKALQCSFLFLPKFRPIGLAASLPLLFRFLSLTPSFLSHSLH
jgi:hypothetical protein